MFSGGIKKTSGMKWVKDLSITKAYESQVIP